MLTALGIGGLLAIAVAPLAQTPVPPAEQAAAQATAQPSAQTDETPSSALTQDLAPLPTQEFVTPSLDRQGTDPTENRTRVEFRYDDADLQQHVDARIGTVRVDIRLSEEFLLRTELPYADVDSKGPPNESESGLGDTLIGLGWRVVGEEEFSVFFGGNVILDTAQHDLLGTGNTVLAPEIATGFGLRNINSEFYPIYRHLLSIGEEDGETGFNMSQFNTLLVTHWGERWWTSVDPRFFIDWEARGQTGMTFDLETGAMLTHSIGLWVRGGLGVFGDDMPGVYDTNVIFGLRFLF